MVYYTEDDGTKQGTNALSKGDDGTKKGANALSKGGDGTKKRTNALSFTTMINEFSNVFKTELPGLFPMRKVEHIVDTEIAHQSASHRSSRIGRTRKVTGRVTRTRTRTRPTDSFTVGRTVLFVRKKDGTMRMFIDYRATNRETRRNRHPVPRVDECLERLSGARYFSKIDLEKWLPSGQNSSFGCPEISVQHPIRLLRVPSPTFRAYQCSAHISKDDERYSGRLHWSFRYCIPRWYTDLQQVRQGAWTIC